MLSGLNSYGDNIEVIQFSVYWIVSIGCYIMKCTYRVSVSWATVEWLVFSVLDKKKIVFINSVQTRMLVGLHWS